jgi:K+-sensing histidine kinase KdpD
MGRGLIFYDVTADKELDHMKSRLVSTVSHELRTPLASIKGYATTLLAEDVKWDPQSQREFLEIISAETDRLSAMVTDLLDLSKIEAGSLSVHRTEILLEEIIQSASQRAYPPPDGQLHLDLQPDMPDLFLDKRLIETIFRNLIENATKYAGEESPITISASVVDGDLLVHVQDEGPGIPVQYQENLFESFYRPETGSKQTNSGFGLGLTICKGFIEAHGGNIWVEPCSTGACFAFSIPIDEE